MNALQNTASAKTQRVRTKQGCTNEEENSRQWSWQKYRTVRVHQLLCEHLLTKLCEIFSCGKYRIINTIVSY